MFKGENKRLTIILGAFVLLILLAIGISIFKNIETEKTRDNEIAKYSDFMVTGGKKLLYIGRTSCSFCQMLEPIIKDFKERYDLEYTYINTDNLLPIQVSAIIDDLGIEDDYGTPYLMFIEDGKIVDKQVGFYGEEAFFDFVKENGAIDADSELLFNYVDYDGYVEVLESSTPKVLVFSQTTCVYCQQARPILHELVEETGVVLNYFEVNQIKDQADEDAVMAFASEALGSDWGTPTMLIVKDGKKVASLAGVNSLEAYVEFLKDNDIIE